MSLLGCSESMTSMPILVVYFANEHLEQYTILQNFTISKLLQVGCQVCLFLTLMHFILNLSRKQQFISDDKNASFLLKTKSTLVCFHSSISKQKQAWSWRAFYHCVILKSILICLKTQITWLFAHNVYAPEESPPPQVITSDNRKIWTSSQSTKSNTPQYHKSYIHLKYECFTAKSVSLYCVIPV